MRKPFALSIVSIFVTFAALVAGGGNALGVGDVIYDSTVTPLPGNLPSVGAQAYAFDEFGDEIDFAGTSRNLSSVTVTMSSWACQSGHWTTADCVTVPGATFPMPITLNLLQCRSKRNARFADCHDNSDVRDPLSPFI